MHFVLEPLGNLFILRKCLGRTAASHQVSRLFRHGWGEGHQGERKIPTARAEIFTYDVTKIDSAVPPRSFCGSS
jgi:hypothetical protein